MPSEEVLIVTTRKRIHRGFKSESGLSTFESCNIDQADYEVYTWDFRGTLLEQGYRLCKRCFKI